MEQKKLNKKIRENLCETYQNYAMDRDTAQTQDWKIQERLAFLTILKKEQKKRLLEIGSGNGRDGLFFQENDFETVCIDLSPAMINLCLQKGLTAYVMDVCEMTFPESSFDAIFSLNTLLHLTKIEFAAVMQHMERLLTPDGVIYLGLYGGYDHEGVLESDFYRPKRFFSYFTDERLLMEVEKVFDILSFNRIVIDSKKSTHFQSLILRKRTFINTGNSSEVPFD